MSNHMGWLLLATGLAFVQCGGRSASDRAAPDAGDMPAAGSGGDASLGACDEAGVAEGGCGGEAGVTPLEPYARLRTACNLDTVVNTHGNPVAINCHIK